MCPSSPSVVFDASQLTETPALSVHRAALHDEQQERCAAVLVAIAAEGIHVEERGGLQRRWRHSPAAGVGQPQPPAGHAPRMEP